MTRSVRRSSERRGGFKRRWKLMRKHKGGSIPGHPPPTLPSYKAPYKGHETLPQVKSPWPSKRSGGALSTSEIKAHNDAILAAMTNEQRAAIPRPRRYSQPGMLNSSGVVIKDKDEMLKIRADRAKANADAYNRLTPEQKQQQRDSQIASQHQEPGGVPYVSKYMQHLKERNAKREAYDNSWIGKANKAFFTPVTRALADAGNFLADYGEKIPIPGMKQLAYAAKLSKAARGEGKPRRRIGGVRTREQELQIEAALRRLVAPRRYYYEGPYGAHRKTEAEKDVMRALIPLQPTEDPYHHTRYIGTTLATDLEGQEPRRGQEQAHTRATEIAEALRIASDPLLRRGPNLETLTADQMRRRADNQEVSNENVEQPFWHRGMHLRRPSVDGSGKGKRRVRRVRKDAYRVRVSFM